MKKVQVKTEVQYMEGGMVIHLIGELDANSSITVDNVLEDAVAQAPKALFLNFSRLNYISSAGLGAILATQQACAARQIPLILIAMQPRIRSIFEALGLDVVLTITDSEPEAFTGVAE
ncbi:STAS domain-containing protein [Pontibacter chitinilyticus]|uniref:STAS domain-containing protein n=1 Tax=Pontibacter chitinilyticus TaxID=2674989 RepID=UPI00321A8D3C